MGCLKYRISDVLGRGGGRYSNCRLQLFKLRLTSIGLKSHWFSSLPLLCERRIPLAALHAGNMSDTPVPQASAWGVAIETNPGNTEAEPWNSQSSVSFLGSWSACLCDKWSPRIPDSHYLAALAIVS